MYVVTNKPDNQEFIDSFLDDEEFFENYDAGCEAFDFEDIDDVLEYCDYKDYQVFKFEDDCIYKLQDDTFSGIVWNKIVENINCY